MSHPMLRNADATKSLTADWYTRGVARAAHEPLMAAAGVAVDAGVEGVFGVSGVAGLRKSTPAPLVCAFARVATADVVVVVVSTRIALVPRRCCRCATPVVPVLAADAARKSGDLGGDRPPDAECTVDDGDCDPPRTRRAALGTAGSTDRCVREPVEKEPAALAAA